MEPVFQILTGQPEKPEFEVVRMSAAEAKETGIIDEVKVDAMTNADLQRHAAEDGNAIPANSKLTRRTARSPAKP